MSSISDSKARQGKKRGASQITPSGGSQGKLRSMDDPLNPFYEDIKQFEEANNILGHLTSGEESRKLAAELTAKHPDQKFRVYADGVWDCFHFGHAKALEQAKIVFPNCELIVGVCSDADTHRYKGKTVMTGAERAESIRHCRWADEVIEDAPWELTQEFILANNIHFVAHDSAPYVNPLISQEATTDSEDSSVEDAEASVVELGALDPDDVYYLVKSNKMFLPTERTEGISTTALINRIVIDYDVFIRRNFKRGFTREELNVSFFRGNKIKAQQKVDDVKEKIKGKLDEFDENVNKLIEGTQHLAGEFMSLFGKDGRIAKVYKKQKTKVLTKIDTMLPFREGLSPRAEGEGRRGFAESSEAVAYGER